MKWLRLLFHKPTLNEELHLINKVLGYKGNSFSKDKLWSWTE